MNLAAVFLPTLNFYLGSFISKLNYLFQNESNISNETCSLLMGIPFAIIMLAVAVTGAFQSFDGIEIVMGSTAVNIFIGIILLFRSRYFFQYIK